VVMRLLAIVALLAAVVGIGMAVTSRQGGKRDREIERKARIHSDRVSCTQRNEIAFSDNKFHRTLKKFMQQAYDARVREAKALKNAPTPRAKAIRRSDLRTAGVYKKLIDSLTLVPYDRSCPIPKAKSHRGKTG
jgi:hypothetical protein